MADILSEHFAGVGKNANTTVMSWNLFIVVSQTLSYIVYDPKHYPSLS